MTSSHRPRSIAGATTALLAAGALAGCGNGLSGTHRNFDPAIKQVTTGRTSSPPEPTHTRPTSGSTKESPGRRFHPGPAESDRSAPSTVNTRSTAGLAAGATGCGPGSLVVGLRAPRGGGAAGSQYELLTFRNVSHATCTVDGHPGVSFVGLGNGTQLGSPAARTGPVRAMRLAPGATGTALLQVVDAGNFDPSQCAPTTSDGLRVYPPDWRVSVFVPFRTEACQRDPGTGPQLSVSAIG
jgi:Protein of unknown function (DUF4232)